MYLRKLICVFAISFSSICITAQEPMLGEIKLFAGNFAPRGWAFCQGQLLPISQNAALFAILGTTYGGDGRTTFALPDMRGRVAAGMGQGNGLNNYTLGQKAGGEAVILNSISTPDHTSTGSGMHQLAIKSFFVDEYGIKIIPVSNFSANANAVNSSFSKPTGGGQTVSNGQALIALNYIIALKGVFPSRN
ncbi:MAG: phage tail protein [Terrimonas sp.]|nr:phage tail protein [Terrimonas sp.]